MLDIIVKNGEVINHDSSIKADIGIKEGKIVLIGNLAGSEAKKILDVEGKYVMPGLIDSHVHVYQDMGEFSAIDSFNVASRAAAFGGTTTMIDFAIPGKDETPLQALNRKQEEAKGNTLINYSFHACYTNRDSNSFKDIEDIISGGIPTIKMFTVYEDAVMIDTGKIFEILKIMSKKGGMAKFHAENAEIIDFEITKYTAKNHKTPYYHALSRPPISETAAMASLITLIEQTEVPSIFLHVSNDQIKRVLETQKNTLPIFFEVCPHYLVLTDEVYSSPNGQNYICSPPIRPKEIQEGLWKLLSEGFVDVVNSDHSDFNLSQKGKYKDDFTKIPNGLPGIETRGAILYSEGVRKGRITLNKFVELTSTKAAKLMGMYPAKGLINIGSDADIVVFDPELTYKLTIDQLHMATDYTPFEEMDVAGKPIHTIVNGKIVIEDGQLVTEEYKGDFVKRGTPILD